MADDSIRVQRNATEKVLIELLAVDLRAAGIDLTNPALACETLLSVGWRVFMIERVLDDALIAAQEGRP